MHSVSFLGCGLRRHAKFRSLCLRFLSTDRSHLSASAAECISLEEKHGPVNRAAVPIVLTRGYGTRMWDVEGREYLDFLSSYGAVCHGHCHPRLVTALASQAATLSLTSSEFHNDKLGAFTQKICASFGYDRCLPMTTGVEACVTAVKLARRWAYEQKKVPENKTTIVCARGNSWGSSLAALSASSDAVVRRKVGPFVPGFKVVDYGDLQQLEQTLSHPHVAAFMVEPIQVEAGVIVPPRGYMRAAAELCARHNVLLIADEVQTGLGRTGRMLCIDHEGVQADMVTLGNALGGGLYPVSAVLGRGDIIGLLRPEERKSTLDGNPLACTVGMEAIDVVNDEKLSERAEKSGKKFREALQKLECDGLKDVRGMGLLNAVEMLEDLGEDLAGDICLAMAQQGILAKPANDKVIRFAPPLVISEKEITQAVVVIQDAIKTVVAEKRSGKPSIIESKQ